MLRRRFGTWVIRWYGQLYSDSGVWRDRTRWLGVPVVKVPSDLWVIQELVVRTRPDLYIETGTWSGGSALYLATVMDALGHGQIVTIDIQERQGRPVHPRIEYITGSSVDPEIVRLVRGRVAAADVVMVDLDSGHRAQHVLAELRAYAELVTVGSYLIVEDTNFDWTFGPGPGEALTEFLAADDRFVVDAACEKFMHTGNPFGFLRRVT
jgi:cephalosporin hydroxylase